jgi:hypothetical protein
LLDRARAHPGQPGRFSAHRSGQQGGFPEHAGRFRAVFVPWKAGGLLDAIERNGTGERDERRGPDSVVSRGTKKSGSGVISREEKWRGAAGLFLFSPQHTDKSTVHFPQGRLSVLTRPAS